MDNLGKFLYMATSALLFIFALTTSIYLYMSLDTYIEFVTDVTNVYDRVEGEAIEPANERREIPWGEVYITITNMEQMHVSKVIVDSYEFTPSDTNLNRLREIENRKIKSYGVAGDVVTYTLY